MTNDYLSSLLRLSSTCYSHWRFSTASAHNQICGIIWNFQKRAKRHRIRVLALWSLQIHFLRHIFVLIFLSLGAPEKLFHEKKKIVWYWNISPNNYVNYLSSYALHERKYGMVKENKNKNKTTKTNQPIYISWLEWSIVHIHVKYLELNCFE